jgi:hypothetical protein
MKGEPWKAVWICYCEFARGTIVGLTRNNITGIHGILVLDESKAIHELDLGDLSSAMSVEMGLDVGFGSYRVISRVNSLRTCEQVGSKMRQTLHTVSREIAQV